MKLLPTLLLCCCSTFIWAQNAYYNSKKVAAMSVTEIKTWFPKGTTDLVTTYRQYGLLDYSIDDRRLNKFKDLITFLRKPFGNSINYEKLLYQIDHYKIVKKAIDANKEEKLKLVKFLPYIQPAPDTSTLQKKEICNSDIAFLKAIYQDDFAVCFNLCECLEPERRQQEVSVLFKEMQGLKLMRNSNGIVTPAIEAPSVADDVLATFSDVAGTNLTSMLVDATAQFLVERTKKELSIAFFDRFRKKMEEYPEIQAWFPEVYSLLDGLLDFQEPSVGKAWVEAFRSDILGLPKNFEAFVLQSDKEPYKTIRKSAEFQYTRLAYHVAEKIMEGTNGADLITYINAFYPTLPNHNTIIADALSVSYLLSKNIRYIKKSEQDSSTQIWIHPTDLVQLNLSAQKYFLGLLYQENPAIFKQLFDIPTQKKIRIPNDKIQALVIQLNSFLVLCENVQQQHQQLQQLLNDTTKTQQEKLGAYLDYTEVAFQLVDYGFTVLGTDTQKAFYHNTLKPIMNNVLATFRAIHDNNYAQVVAKSLNIIHKLVNNGLEKSILSSADLDKIKQVKGVKEVLEQLSFYGNFLVDIGAAKDTESMRKILNKYAAPIGSYKIKRNTAFSVDLNAYPGIYGGYEYLPEQTANSNQNGFVWGVTAPIGLSFNWASRQKRTITKGADLKEGDFLNPKGSEWKTTTGASNSIFASIVDIGAAVSYRWNSDDQTNGFPDSLNFTQILSPGLFWVHGFKNAPISMMVGAQYTPLLRSITQNGVVTDELNAWRFGVSFVVDIPIFNLYRKRRK